MPLPKGHRDADGVQVEDDQEAAELSSTVALQTEFLTGTGGCKGRCRLLSSRGQILILPFQPGGG